MIAIEIERSRPIRWAILGLGCLFIGYLISISDPKVGLLLPVLPVILALLILSFQKYEFVLYGLIILAFSIAGLSRYFPGVPYGLGVDALLVLSFLTIIFHSRIGWDKRNFKNVYVLALLIWLLFSFLQLGNSLAPSKAAWFYANRGLSFYPLMISITALFVFHKKPRAIEWFLAIWAFLSVLGTLWGMKQLFLGVSFTEQQWLDAGAASTHVLFGRLRVFSFFSDAAQFGANQAHTSLVFGLIALYPGKMRFRWLYLFVAVITLYGMMISGTRGALAIPAIGGLTYLIMTRNFKIVIIGILLGLGAFGFLKYTSIGQSNYQINRMRTALDSDDPSLRVRKERLAVLGGYLADKPLGGGIGSAGFWGKRFSPGSFLAEIGTDGHYTRIWMETGIIGLWLYILMLISMIGYFGVVLWKLPNSGLRQIYIGFYSGFVGICLASYTNGLLTQIPTGPLVFMSLAFIELGRRRFITS